jgi:IclR family mhp operon transcriptional activator
LRRGLDVLRVIRNGAGLSLGDLHRETAAPKASLLRIVRTLEEAGWIQRRLADGAYLPLPQPAPPLSNSRQRARLIEIAAPDLRELHQRMPWPSDIAVREGLGMLVLESNRSLTGIVVNRGVIGYRPGMVWSAMGRAYLAFCPESEREALLKALRSSSDVLDQASRRGEWLQRIIAQTQRQGYAVRDPRNIGPDAEALKRFSAIAVPVQGGGGVQACLSCIWISDLASEAQIVDRHLAQLLRAAARIGARLAAEKV